MSTLIKIMRNIFVLSLMFFASFSYAQTTSSTYLENVTLYTQTNELLGIFKGNDFLADHDVASGSTSKIQLIGSDDNIIDDSDIEIVSFQVSVAGSDAIPFETKQHNFTPSPNQDNYVYFKFRNAAGDTQATVPSESNRVITVSSEQRSSEPLLVSVVWDESFTKIENTQKDGRGKWLYTFSTGPNFSNLARRNKVEEVFLTASSGSETFNLCTFDASYGERFLVLYPNCAEKSDLATHTFKTGLSYEVFFTDKNGTIINAGGDGKYQLPQVPGYLLPTNILSFEKSIVDHPSIKGGKYFNVKVNVSDDREGEQVRMLVRTEINGEMLSSPIGTVPLKKGSYSLPSTVPELALRNGFYQLVTEYNGSEIQVEDLGRISDTDSSIADNDTVNNGGGGLFTVPENLKNGIVPGDCGYDIKTLSNPNGVGRACGLVDIIGLIQRIIEYIFFLILPIAAIVFAYAGFSLMTSGSSDTKRSAAKRAMTSLVVGIIIIMGAWFVVQSVLKTLGVDTSIAEQFLDIDL